MGWYASRPGRFAGQVLGDVGVLLWTVSWAVVAVVVRGTVARLAGPARETARTAQRVSDDLGSAATQASEVPGLGEQLRRPFDAASGSLGDLITAANRQADSIEGFATLAGWLVFLVPVALVLAYWLPRRIAFYRRATAAQQFLDSAADLDLFALRAMASQPMHVLAGISPDPVAAWRRGDRAVIGRLAEVELARSGLRLPAGLRAVAEGSGDTDDQQRAGRPGPGGDRHPDSRG
jgi:hypothetical protein